MQVLLWDYTHPKQDSPNAQFFARDWPAKPTAPVRLNVSNLEPGEYKVNITRVGYRHNDIYTAYLDLGSPAGLPNNRAYFPTTSWPNFVHPAAVCQKRERLRSNRTEL